MLKITLPATIEKLSTRADNTITVTISTQELPPEHSAVLFTLKGKLGWLLFAETPLDEKDIPDDKPEFKNEKSQSQRLRACLYRYWEKNTNKATPFDTYWKNWTEKKINEIKETL